jgi:hypothetical protein
MCRHKLIEASARARGHTADYLDQFSEGMSEVVWSVISAEDAIALGVRSQAIREINFELERVAPDDRREYFNSFFNFRRMQTLRRMNRLKQYHSGSVVVEGEVEDMKAASMGISIYPVPDPASERWTKVNIAGAEFARDVYCGVFEIAQKKYHGEVLEIPGQKVLHPGRIQKLA